MIVDDRLDEPVQLPDEVTAQLDALFERRLSTWGEIVARLALDAGYGELTALAPETRQILEETVDEACDDWHVAAEPATEARSGAIAPHQRLLLRYHALGSAILDVQDAALRHALGVGAEQPAWRHSKP
jgi:hypothetical protein